MLKPRFSHLGKQFLEIPEGGNDDGGGGVPFLWAYRREI
jgi:hypothetical protein